MALSKIDADSVDLTDNFAFTGTVTGAGAPFIFFEAQLTSNQSISNNSTTTLSFNNVITDTASAYTSGTYRYTPTTAGYWLMQGRMLFTSGTVFGSRHYFLNCSIQKNGSAVRDFTHPKETSNTDSSINSDVTAIVYANGTTDYFTITHYHYDYGATAAITAEADGRRTYFTGYYLGA
jgi:hypothetical protein